MGRQNQRRRADKKRHRNGRGNGGRRVTASEGDLKLTVRQVEAITTNGALAAASGSSEAVRVYAERLALLARSTTPAVVTLVVVAMFSELLASHFDRGWQPSELVRQAGRRRSRRHAELVVEAMSAAECWQGANGAAMPERWAEQLGALGVSRTSRPGRDWLAAWISEKGDGEAFVDLVVVVLEVLGALLPLPPIEPVLPPPSQWKNLRDPVGGPVEHPALARVRALLSKAESTSFEAEAESLTAKAQELMARYAIDGALARSQAPRAEAPTMRRIAVDDPYARAKSELLVVAAHANDVRCVWDDEFALMAVVGFARDLDAVETLFTSLLVQASRAMLAKGSARAPSGASRTRSFRQSFIVAFASRIGERLAAAAAMARAEAEAEMATSLAPVLASRAREIDDEVARLFRHTRMVDGVSVTSAEGWRAGRIAAELATLGPDHPRLASG